MTNSPAKNRAASADAVEPNTLPMLIDGKWIMAAETDPVRSPFDGHTVAAQPSINSKPSQRGA